MEKKLNKEIVYSALLVLIPIVLLFGLYIVQEFKNETEPVATEINEPEPVFKKRVPNPFDNVRLMGQAAIVKDLNTGKIIFEKNSEKAMPLASITKLMTALVTEETIKNNRYIAITPQALEQEGDSFLRLGEIFNLKKLMDYTLVASSNDGAAAVAQAVQNRAGDETFTEKMNQTAIEIGMKSAQFFNETGLDQNEIQAGAFASADDVAVLMEYALKTHPEIFEATRETSYSTYSQDGILHQATNTNSIAGNLPGLLVSKTGYTDLAGGNLAVVVDPGLNTPVAIVILGSTFEGRFDDVQKLSDNLNDYFKYKNQN